MLIWHSGLFVAVAAAAAAFASAVALVDAACHRQFVGLLAGYHDYHDDDTAEADDLDVAHLSS